MFTRWLVVLGVAILSVGVAGAGQASREQEPSRVDIPANATVLEGTPVVRIDSAGGTVTRRVLDKTEAAQNRLKISVIDGQYYWTSRGNRPLRLDSSGAYTYLSSEPGTYIRFTRIDDRIDYVEHVDQTLQMVTWWGELRIVVGTPTGP